MTQTMISVGLAVAAIALTLAACIWWASVARATKHQVSQLRDETMHLVESTRQLVDVTGKFRTKLLGPYGAGRWGEIQLQSLLNSAGLVLGRDYVMKQPANGGIPDMTVFVPGSGGKMIHVDAKTSFKAMVEDGENAFHDSDEARIERLSDSMQIHAAELAKRRYQDEPGSADFVIMYVPNEAFVLAALSVKPKLIDQALEKGILIASPLTMLMLLKSYAEGFQSIGDLPAIYGGVKTHASQLQLACDAIESATRGLRESASNLGNLEAAVKATHQKTEVDRARASSFAPTPPSEVHVELTPDADVAVRSVSDYGG
jgi:hypothetical protein